MDSLHEPKTQTKEYKPAAQREDELRHALRGLILTADDEIVIGWLARQDQHTVETIRRFFDRVRRAGNTDIMDLELALRDRAKARGVQEPERGLNVQ